MTKPPSRFLWVLSLFVLHGRLLAGQDAESTRLQRLYGDAVSASEKGDLATAVTLMDSVARSDATVPNAWWNLGLWYAALNQPEQALTAWKAYHALDSTDWRGEAKLIQTYQALADLPRRDSALDGLLAHRARTRNKELRDAEVFCREQAVVGGQRVMVMQTFSPKGDMRVFFTFLVLDSSGKVAYRYSLGSYEQTTITARETGQIGAKDRLYHLDYYDSDSHGTLGFYAELPPYDTVREAVWIALTARASSHGQDPDQQGQ